MAVEDVFIEAVKSQNNEKWQTWEGIVTAVNSTTCTVERAGLPDLLDVRLDAIEGNKNGRFRLIPKLRSEVLCLAVENQPGESCLVKYTAIERVECVIENMAFEIDKAGCKISKEGQSLKKVMTDLINIIAGIVVVQGKGPDILKLKTVMSDINTFIK